MRPVADRVAGGDAVADDDRESLEDRAEREARGGLRGEASPAGAGSTRSSSPAPNGRDRRARIARQPAIIMMPWPTVGAMIGTAMNTIIASDITLAMRRPPKVSRTIEMAITRVAPAPMPWMAAHRQERREVAGDGALRCSR